VSSLRNLLREPRDPNSAVARQWDPASRTDRTLCWGEFCGHVGALRERIRDEPDGPWLLLTENAYTFAVGLFALWHSGRHAVSPPNTGSGTLRALHTRVAGVLSDRADWFPEAACLHPLQEPDASARWLPEPLDPEALALDLFTSGTTGAEKPVTKRLRHLDDEVEQLVALWDGLVADAVVFATASHQHVYGLLFGVLWPLRAGRPFQADHFLHAGELVPRMREAGRSVLASVPTHLRRLARSDHFAALRGGCRAVFSSGGLLEGATAQRVAAALGAAPLEVLGSTETGGVAWRQQQAEMGEGLWTPLPAVTVTRDTQTGVARVRSPFVSVEVDGRGFATGDLIGLEEGGRFRLEGRADRVVKVGEKRLDLSQMESQLRAHPLIAELALVVVERDAEARVAAAVVPTESGWRQLRETGRRGFGRSIAAALGPDWDPVLHPRLLRVVSRLPENATGKLSAESLRELFREAESLDKSGDAVSDRPQVLEELRGSDFVERLCRVPPELSCFAGHFPDVPVVPGVLQLDWAMQLASQLLGAAPPAEGLESVKFRAPLRPGVEFRIHVRVERGRVEFRLWSDDAEHARGRVRLGTAREPRS